MAIGMYVNMKIGNVNKYIIFLYQTEWICFHSVMVVIVPNKNREQYTLKMVLHTW